ncbi:MAG: hypothetical protein PHI79_07335 [Sulfurovaceae bacterium]|nr:hypothetical protein [Sulfurovaceae bacterium]MDD5549386.1 hypothetical protein [Sulfurovaceae bacterium]
MAKIFYGIAIIVWVVGGLFGFILSLGIVKANLGIVATVIAFFIAPITFTFAPWYEVYAHSNWQVIIINYGSAILGGIFAVISNAMEDR